MAKLIHGSGMCLMECLRLRVKDLEFERRAIIVRDGKGAQDWVTVLPDSKLVDAVCCLGLTHRAPTAR